MIFVPPVYPFWITLSLTRGLLLGSLLIVNTTPVPGSIFPHTILFMIPGLLETFFIPSLLPVTVLYNINGLLLSSFHTALPPLSAEFFANVALKMNGLLLRLKMPPPLTAWLLYNVAPKMILGLLLIFIIPPPSLEEELLENVTSKKAGSLLTLVTPPPSIEAELPSNTTFVRVGSLSELHRPPPLSAELLLKLIFSITGLLLISLLKPPPTWLAELRVKNKFRRIG
jgi:hypothetical protein